MKLLFAPLKGLTDAHFRSFFFSHFSGFDGAVAPFLLSSEDEAIKAQREGGSIPVPLIPQLMGQRSDRLIPFTRLLKEHGFEGFNLNLGCPAPVVIRKNKGSALLSEPQALLELLTELSAESALPFSVKTRIGYSGKDELRNQLPRWRSFPLTDLIIHGRTAEQFYSGSVDWSEIARCADVWGKPVIFNGDITTCADYETLTREMGDLMEGAMIGRGVFYNPFLAEEIRKGGSLPVKEKRDRFIEFHRDLADEMGTRPKSFARLKGLWTYFSRFAGIPAPELEKLKRLDDPLLFRENTEKWIRANLR